MRYNLHSEYELIELLRHSNDDAFKELYHRYWKLVYVTALHKLQDKDLAEQLTERIFMDLWRKRDETDLSSVEAYLKMAVRDAIINHIKVQLSKSHPVNPKDLSANTGNTDTVTLYHDLYSAIEKGIALLPEQTQEVFRLSRTENRSVSEIARHMRISEEAVEHHIRQSLRALNYYLKEYLFVLLMFLCQCSW